MDKYYTAIFTTPTIVKVACIIPSAHHLRLKKAYPEDSLAIWTAHIDQQPTAPDSPPKEATRTQYDLKDNI